MLIRGHPSAKEHRARVSIFYCCVSNSHKCNVFRQHAGIISWFCRSNIRMAQLRSLLRASQGQNQGVSQTRLLSGGSGEEGTFKLIQADSRIQFLAGVGPMYPFPCCLSWGVLSLEATPTLSHMVLYVFKLEMALWVFESRWLPLFPSSSATSQRKFSAFNIMIRLGELGWSPLLKINSYGI